MKFRIPPLFPSIAFGAALTLALSGCATTDEVPPGPAAKPEAKGDVKKPEAKKPEAKKPEAKKPEAKKPEAKKPVTPKKAPSAPPADLSPGEAARRWWQAVMSEDRKSADLYVVDPLTNEFLIQYVHELRKNADADSLKELESMGKAAFGRATEESGFLVIQMTKEGEAFFKVILQKQGGRWLILTIN